MDWEGRDYGIPTKTAPRSIIYRADMLAEVGPSTRTQGRRTGTTSVKWRERLTKVDEDRTPLRWGFRVPVTIRLSGFRFCGRPAAS